MKHFNLKTILILLVILAIGIGCTIRIVHLNQKYPNANVERYTMNETVTLGNIEVTITDYQLLTVPEIKERIEGYDVTYVDSKGNDKDERILLAEVHLKNIGEDLDGFSVYLCTLQSGAYTQGMAMEYYPAFNSHLSNPDVVTFLEPGKDMTIYVPYSIYEISFSKNAWEKIDTRTFELVFSLYPINRVVTLK